MKPDFYTPLVDDYDRMVDTPARVAREVPVLASLLRAAGARRVLEVGCATGGHAVALAREGFEVVAIDPCEGFIERARAQPDLPPSVTFLPSSLEQWAPKAGGMHDALLCLGHTLPHLVVLRPLPNVIGVMAHVLCPGALVVLQLLNPTAIERLGVWSPPVRSWRDGAVEITHIRQWIDHGDSLQLVVTRVRRGGGEKFATTWDQELPKVRAGELRSALEQGEWTDVRIVADWDMAPFEEETSVCMVVTARRPGPSSEPAA